MRNIVHRDIVISAPDGRRLSTCDAKKAQWYIDRGLAEQIDEHNIRLNFEPAVEVEEEGEDFRTSIREPRCVICGADDGLVKHHILPPCYVRELGLDRRRYFFSHDMMLLCHRCKVRCDDAALVERSRIAAEFGAPLEGNCNRMAHHRDARPAVKAACALIRYKAYLQQCDKEEAAEDLQDEAGQKGQKLSRSARKRRTILPEARLQGMEQEVAQFLEKPKEELTDADLEAVTRVPLTSVVAGHQSHAEIVCNQIKHDQHLVDLFIRRWRLFFIHSMQPKFLNPAWRVEFNLETLRGTVHAS
eukprot:TRINITY_DN574_c0_g1_i3.p1 TRINITY_DN574_c0_g1~~TRINITY_DN574_c0_g1_i3.p1  ORF type:complete len:302 (-),score=49.07 TRINITY_DN574_c0_g1_i3:23-928(-)